MPYDVFISYSSLDNDWALKLNQSLIKANLNVFLDTRRLRAGEDWDEQLKTALNESTHLVVLWSVNARVSDWVNKEVGFFSVAISGTSRKLIPIVLNDDPKA